MRITRKSRVTLGLRRDIIEPLMRDLRVDLQPKERRHAAAI